MCSVPTQDRTWTPFHAQDEMLASSSWVDQAPNFRQEIRQSYCRNDPVKYDLDERNFYYSSNLVQIRTDFDNYLLWTQRTIKGIVIWQQYIYWFALDNFSLLQLKYDIDIACIPSERLTSSVDKLNKSWWIWTTWCVLTVKRLRHNIVLLVSYSENISVCYRSLYCSICYCFRRSLQKLPHTRV